MQPPMPAEPAKAATLDTGPADQALAAVRTVGGRRLSDQKLTPVGTPPPYPGLDPRDFVPVTALKAVADLEVKLAGKDLTAKDRASLTKQLEKAKAAVAAIEKSAAEGTPAQPPPTVVDTGPASLEPLPAAQADVLGDAVARALGMVEPSAKSISDKAMALMKGTGVAPVIALAKAEEGAVRSDLERELQGIAAAAGVTAEQLTAKVGEQKALVVKEKQALEAKLHVSSVTATKQVEQRVGQENKEIAGAKAAVAAENVAKRSAVEGPPDTEAIEAKRDEYLTKVSDVAAMAHAATRSAVTRRNEDLAKAASDHKGAVKQAADTQAAAIRRHWAENARQNDAGQDRPIVEDKGMAEARATVTWGSTRSGAVDAELKGLQTAATTEGAAMDAAVDAAADSAKEQIRDWAARQEGGERSWWKRLLDRVKDWFSQANADNDAWERQRNAESRGKMAGDLTALASLKQAHSAGNHQALTAELSKLDGEQRVLAAKYLQGGMSSLQFVAESTTQRIAARRVPELAKKMEEQAIASWSWEDLNLLALRSNPGFNALVLANKVKGGVEGWGTDEAQVYGGLGGARTAVERAALAKCYQVTFGVSLEADVEGDMEDHELQRAKALMVGKSARADAATIKEAVRGAGTDEEAIKTALRGKTVKEIAAIRSEYKRMYGVELTADLADDFDPGAEKDTAMALAAGDVDTADAAELEDAMAGVGTAEEKLRKVYERIREEEEATAKREQLTPAELQQRIRARNDRVKAKYNAKYGDLETNMTAELADVDEGAVATLKARKAPLVDNAELKLMQALHSGDATQIDAARALREHEGVYASDDEIEKITRNQHKQAELTVDLELAAERARITALWEAGDLTPEQFTAARAALEQRRKQRADAIAAKAQANMGELKQAYADATGGAQSFDQLVLQETSGVSQLEIQDLVAAGGALKPEDEIYYSVAGAGTDEDKLKEVLRGKTPADIQELRKKYEVKHGTGSFDRDILGDLSGREDLDVGHALTFGDTESFGRQLAEAKTPEERRKVLDAMRTVLRERKAFEQTGSIGSLWSATGDPLNSAAQMQQALQRAEQYDAALSAAQAHGADPSAQNPDLEAAKAKFELNFAGALEAQEQVRKQIDAYTDVAAQVGAVVVGLAVTVLTAGAAGPAALAAAAAWGAAASAAASMAIKLQLKGAAYSWEEAGVDAAVGAVDAGVSALSAGMGKAVVDALENALKRQVAMQLAKEGAEELTESGFRALVKEAMAEAIENGVQGLPSEALAAALSDETWKSGDPFRVIVKATGTAGAMGAGIGVGLHGAGAGGGALYKGLKGLEGGMVPGMPASAVDAPSGAVGFPARAAVAPSGVPASVIDVPADAVDVPAGAVDVPAGAVDAPTAGPVAKPDDVDVVLPPDADPAQVVPKAVEAAPTPPQPSPPRSPHAGDVVDLDPRQPHVGDDGIIDLDDPRNEWMLEDAFAGQLPDALAGDPKASRDFFDAFVTDKPGLEAALLSNPVTGEHIVVQGGPRSVDIRSGHGVWEELIPPDKAGVGRWEMVAHSHPVDPATGVTPEWARVPSGSSGDFAWSVYEATVNGRPVVQDIRITTETGPAVTRYGYDPTSGQPYSIDMPTVDGGREVLRFPTIDDYHDWYKGRFGGDMGEVPADFPGKKRADGPGEGAVAVGGSLDPTTTPAVEVGLHGKAGESSTAIDADPTRDAPRAAGPAPAAGAPELAPGAPGGPTTPTISALNAEQDARFQAAKDAIAYATRPGAPIVSPSSLGTIGTTESTSYFRKLTAKAILSDPKHPLRSLLQGGALPRSTTKGLGEGDWLEDPRFLEAGHGNSAKGLASDGGPDARAGGLRLQTAYLNRLQSATVEHPRIGGLVENDTALLIGGVPVDVQTGHDLVAAGYLDPQHVRMAPVIRFDL